MIPEKEAMTINKITREMIDAKEVETTREVTIETSTITTEEEDITTNILPNE